MKDNISIRREFAKALFAGLQPKDVYYSALFNTKIRFYKLENVCICTCHIYRKKYCIQIRDKI